MSATTDHTLSSIQSRPARIGVSGFARLTGFFRKPGLPRVSALRLLLAVPVLGWVLRDVLYGTQDNIYYLLVAFVSLWAMAVMVWGIVALTVVALALVPTMFFFLIMITLGN